MKVWRLKEILNELEDSDNILIRKRSVYSDESSYSDFVVLTKKNENGDVEIYIVRRQEDSLPKELV